MTIYRLARRHARALSTVMIVAGLALATAAPAVSQPAAPGAAAPGAAAPADTAALRVRVLPLVSAGQVPDAPRAERGLIEVLQESLRDEFREAGFDLVGDSAQGAADLVCVGHVVGLDERIMLSTRVHVAEDQTIVAASARFGMSDLTVFNLPARVFGDLRPALEEVAAAGAANAGPPSAPDADAPAPVPHSLVLMSPDEGMRVTLGGPAGAGVAGGRQDTGRAGGAAGTPPHGELLEIGMVTDGTLELPYLPFRPGQRLVVAKKKPGYWPETEEIRVPEAAQTVPLSPLEPKRRLEAMAYTTLARRPGLGLGLRTYLRPGWTFAAAETTAYPWDPDTVGVPSAYYHDLRLLLGRYVGLGPLSRFRFGVHTGFGLTVAAGGEKTALAYRNSYLELFGMWTELRLQPVAIVAGPATRWFLDNPAGTPEEGLFDSGRAGVFFTLATTFEWPR